MLIFAFIHNDKEFQKQVSIVFLADTTLGFICQFGRYIFRMGRDYNGEIYYGHPHNVQRNTLCTLAVWLYGIFRWCILWQALADCNGAVKI